MKFFFNKRREEEDFRKKTEIILELRRNAKEIRKDILKIIYKTKSPHIGSSLSCVDILTALYFRILKIYPSNPEFPHRDRFILSKGHGCPALYATLVRRGFFKKEILDKFAVDNGTLEQHPTCNISLGIEASTGSLGHGLSMGIGMAISGKYDKSNYRVFVLMSDGECNEGSVWEAAMFAPKHNLDNLIAIIDYNKIQAMNRTNEIVSLEPLVDKWKAFGWATHEINGHDFREIIETLEQVPFETDKPSVIVAHTIKGKGVSFMEDKVLWHFRHPNEEEYKAAWRELK